MKYCVRCCSENQDCNKQLFFALPGAFGYERPENDQNVKRNIECRIQEIVVYAESLCQKGKIVRQSHGSEIKKMTVSDSRLNIGFNAVKYDHPLGGKLMVLVELRTGELRDEDWVVKGRRPHQ